MGGEGVATAFNLLEVVSRRFVSGTGFAGGEVLWQDGFWERGHVAVNGVLYPIAEEFHIVYEKPPPDTTLRSKYARVSRTLSSNVHHFLTQINPPQMSED